jgi:hypothetical protein
MKNRNVQEKQLAISQPYNARSLSLSRSGKPSHIWCHALHPCIGSISAFPWIRKPLTGLQTGRGTTHITCSLQQENIVYPSLSFLVNMIYLSSILYWTLPPFCWQHSSIVPKGDGNLMPVSESILIYSLYISHSKILRVESIVFAPLKTSTENHICYGGRAGTWP